MKPAVNLIVFILLAVWATAATGEPMSDAAVKQRMDQLAVEIIEHNHLYAQGQPEISDAAYDRLAAQLAALEKRYPQFVRPDSPVGRIGPAPPADDRIKHPTPMLSLNKCDTRQALASWMRDIQHRFSSLPLFVAEEKMDGVAVELIYQAGRLDHAATRGNGMYGRDITYALSGARGVPMELTAPVDVAVRGEVFMRRLPDDATDRPHDAKLRNAVAGILNQTRPSAADRQRLEVMAFDVALANPSGLSTHWQTLLWLEKLGLQTNPTNRLIDGVSAMESYLNDMQYHRLKADYGADGIVIKVDSPDIRQALGQTEHAPRWAMAYKFSADQALTVLTDIVVQIGRRGRATPVATFEPIEIGGAVLRHAALHNQAAITRLGMDIGDQILVARQGGVIPVILGVAQNRAGQARVWRMPVQCPDCGHALIVRGRHHWCPNRQCPAQIKGRLVYFIQKMQLRGVGQQRVATLVDQRLLAHPESFYQWDGPWMKDVGGFSATQIDRFLTSRAASRQKPFETVMSALGLPGLGRKNLRSLAKAGYASADAIMQADPAELQRVAGIGPKTAQAIRGGFQPRVIESIHALQACGLNL
jgi:DNA ligase (NAD+)